jgi:hypothetical protein
MKTHAELERDLADARRMIERLKAQLTAALDEVARLHKEITNTNTK